MVYEILMPVVDAGMTRATLVDWLRREGDKVDVYETLYTIETTKTVLEIEAEQEGVLLKQLFAPGNVIPVQATVALIGDNPGESFDLEAIEKKNQILIENLPDEED